MANDGQHDDGDHDHHDHDAFLSGLWLSPLRSFTTSGLSSTALRSMKSPPQLWSFGDQSDQDYHHDFHVLEAADVTMYFFWRFPLDYLSDSIYVMDILIHFRTGIEMMLGGDGDGDLKDYGEDGVEVNHG